MKTRPTKIERIRKQYDSGDIDKALRNYSDSTQRLMKKPRPRTAMSSI